MMRVSLRAQIALATGGVSLIVVALPGALIALSMDHRDRLMIDHQLAARAERVLADVDKLLSDGPNREPSGVDGYGDLLDGSESLVRLFDGNLTLAQRGAIPEQQLAPPTVDGLSTVTVDGAPWRSYVRSAGGNIRLQVLQSLEPVNDRRNSNTRLVVLVTLIAAAVSGLAGWLVGRRVLRPLHRLTDGAVSIANDPDPKHRLPTVAGRDEVATLSTTLNGMLDRLSATSETTRRFAADIGHELRGPLTASTTYLETLLASSDLPGHARDTIAASYAQQERMVAVLGMLQILARGDAHALPPQAEIEAGILVEELVRFARHRYPGVSYSLTDSSEGATISGWGDGLRIAVSNLLDNAAIHGRPDGNVDVEVTADERTVRIVVADNGPGIPPTQREYLRQRFTRGNYTAPGTGLGLALVDQQASLHGGSLRLSEAAAGGLRAEMTLPSIGR